MEDTAIRRDPGGFARLRAPAKLNLSLAITGMRDGYHLLDSVMQEIDLCDELDVRPARDITLTVTGGRPLPADNTIVRAAELFCAAVPEAEGAEIRVQKRIPEQAGLGGGSSDAAAVLRGLNALYGRPLAGNELAELARQIGADCPFFLAGGTQRARGTGEILTPVANRCRFSLLLLKPRAGVATRTAFALSDRLPVDFVDTGACARALESGDAEGYFAAAGNALQRAAEVLVPGITCLGERLAAAGARFWQVTGSGSCVFAVFKDDAERDRAAAAFAAEPDLFSTPARFAGSVGDAALGGGGRQANPV